MATYNHWGPTIAGLDKMAAGQRLIQQQRVQQEQEKYNRERQAPIDAAALRLSGLTGDAKEFELASARRNNDKVISLQDYAAQLGQGREVTVPNPALNGQTPGEALMGGAGPLRPETTQVQPYSPQQKAGLMTTKAIDLGLDPKAWQDVTKNMNADMKAKHEEIVNVLTTQGPEAAKRAAIQMGATPDQVRAIDNMQVDSTGKVIQELPNGGQIISVVNPDGSRQLFHSTGAKAAVTEASLNPDGSLDDGGLHFTEDMLRGFAETYEKTGKMPSLGMKAGPLRKAIMYYHGMITQEQGKSGYDVAGGWAETKAQGKSLDKQRVNMDFASSFIDNISQQVERVDTVFDRISQEYPRLINKPIKYWDTSIMGEADRMMVEMYVAEVSAETARLSAGNPQSIAELSASAREKWENIHPTDMPLSELRKLLKETQHAANMRYNTMDKVYKRTLKQGASAPSARGTDTKQYPVPNQQAIDYLKQNPQFKDAFKEKFGSLPEGM